MIPAMVILGELSDIFGDAQRGVWLEIRLRLRARSKLFFTPFPRPDTAFSGYRGAQHEGSVNGRGFPNLVAQPHRALMRYELRSIGQNGKKVEATLPKR